jgi:hypothetical protein
LATRYAGHLVTRIENKVNIKNNGKSGEGNGSSKVN